MDREIPDAVKKHLWRDDGLWSGIIFTGIAWILYFLEAAGWIHIGHRDPDAEGNNSHIVMLVAVVISVCGIAYSGFSVWRWFRLMRRGIVVEGEVIFVSGAYKGALVRLDYAYAVAGKLYKKAMTTAEVVAEKKPVGTPVRVLVDPSRPSLALLLDDVFPKTGQDS